MRLNSYKEGIVFAEYQRMRSKGTCWDGTSHVGPNPGDSTLKSDPDLGFFQGNILIIR